MPKKHEYTTYTIQTQHRRKTIARRKNIRVWYEHNARTIRVLNDYNTNTTRRRYDRPSTNTRLIEHECNTDTGSRPIQYTYNAKTWHHEDNTIAIGTQYCYNANTTPTQNKSNAAKTRLQYEDNTNTRLILYWYKTNTRHSTRRMHDAYNTNTIQMQTVRIQHENSKITIRNTNITLHTTWTNSVPREYHTTTKRQTHENKRHRIRIQRQMNETDANTTLKQYERQC